MAGAFGLVSGPPVTVRLRFQSSVRRFVTRRQWHATQVFDNDEEGRLLMAMTVADTPELENWVRSFGSTVTVLEPRSLRERIALDARRVVKLYRPGDAQP